MSNQLINMQITLPGFEGKEFPHKVDDDIEGNTLKFCVIETCLDANPADERLEGILGLDINATDKRLEGHLRRLGYYIEANYQKLVGYPGVINPDLADATKSLLYKGLVYFSKDSREEESNRDFDASVNGIPKDLLKMEDPELETILGYVKDESERLRIRGIIQSSDPDTLYELIFRGEPEQSDDVITFRAKLMESIFMKMLNRAVESVNGDGIDTLFLQQPYYFFGPERRDKIGAVIAFYQTSQLKKMLETLKEQHDSVKVRYGNRLQETN